MPGEFDVGQRIGGKYRIEGPIGEGGLARVLSATHLELDQLVAIKHLRPEVAEKEELAERFLREARIAARIRSDHVVRVIDVAKTEGGCPYIVMEYLEGDDLGQMLGSAGPFQVPDAVDYVLQACEALAEAHAIGVVHRDLKPENLFLAKRAAGARVVKVLDFGISKVADPVKAPSSVRERALTAENDRFGTPAYMSPEQIKSSAEVDVRTDVWSIGVVLYELLAGRLPFDSEHLPMLCVQIATEAPAPMRTNRPDIPEALEAVVRKCLEKPKEKRYANIAELAQDLIPFGPDDARTRAEHVRRVVQEGGQRVRPPTPLSVPLTPLAVQVRATATTAPRLALPAPTISSWAPEDVGKSRRGVGTFALIVTAVAAAGIAFYVAHVRPDFMHRRWLAWRATAASPAPATPPAPPPPVVDVTPPAPATPPPAAPSTPAEEPPAVAAAAAQPAASASARPKPGTSTHGRRHAAASSQTAAATAPPPPADSSATPEPPPAPSSTSKNAEFGDRQ